MPQEVCKAWNGQQIGTCYSLTEIDSLALELMRAFGGGQCAREWACAALATCYFSANPRHWCRHEDKATCAAAFDGCGVSHIVVPDFPAALEPAVETAPAVDTWVDPATPQAAHTKVVNGETLTLVFSDEFEEATRDFRSGMDARWEAMHYSGNTTSCFRPDGVYVSEGRAVLRYEQNATQDLRNAEYAFRSGMLQGWNKFCYTGGYLEVLPLPFRTQSVRVGYRSPFDSSLLGDSETRGDIESVIPLCFGDPETAAVM